jgi:hypothetical protein
MFAAPSAGYLHLQDTIETSQIDAIASAIIAEQSAAMLLDDVVCYSCAQMQLAVSISICLIYLLTNYRMN